MQAFIMIAIARVWGSSKLWWKRMVATAAFVSFVSLLRGSGVLSVPVNGLTWVVGLTELANPKRPPRRHSGVLLLVPKRKSKQDAPSWIPIRAGLVTKLVARHMRWRAGVVPQNAFLFPSRKLRIKNGKRSWRPHPANPLSPASFCALLRMALRQVCGLKTAQANIFTVHSLRVGGINYYKSIGVSIGMRAKIAAHKSLRTSRRYLRLLPIEQFQELEDMVGA